jgi:hypothetical protein
MTTIQARSIEKARREFTRAKNELNVHRLSETRYRGIPTIRERKEASKLHGTFIYRGRTYTK